MALHDQIHGSWGQFDIRKVVQQDIPAILDFLRENFHRDEPTGRHCVYDEGFIKEVQLKVVPLLETSGHFCLIATDIATGAIAGAQLQFILTKEQAKIYANSSDQSPFFQRNVMNAIYEPLRQVMVTMFDKFGVEEVVWNFIASVSKKHRGQGLATELFRRMVNLVRKENQTVVFSLYSSPFSRRCAEKMGFVELARSRFTDALDPATGLPFLPEAVGQEDFNSLMALQIN